MGGETEAAWCVVLEDLLARGLRVPDLGIVDGGIQAIQRRYRPETAEAAVWPEAIPS